MNASDISFIAFDLATMDGRNFEVIETRDDHSASVTAARFACNGSKLLSSSADK
jgi:hypothetical protein